MAGAVSFCGSPALPTGSCAMATEIITLHTEPSNTSAEPVYSSDMLIAAREPPSLEPVDLGFHVGTCRPTSRCVLRTRTLSRTTACRKIQPGSARCFGRCSERRGFSSCGRRIDIRRYCRSFGAGLRWCRSCLLLECGRGRNEQQY